MLKDGEIFKVVRLCNLVINFETYNFVFMEIKISDEIKSACPHYRMVKIEATVKNGYTPSELTTEIERFADSMRSVMEMPDVNKRPGIAATRSVYKACGKDPNRYRPSTEALCRRIVGGKELYTVDAIVDAMNLLSLKSGYSVGAFDKDKIESNTLTLGVGREGEPYEGIGRGPLNIAGLPILRDSVGGVGTPTSDNERTKITAETRNLLVTVHIFGTDMPEDEVLREAERLLVTYCVATDFNAVIVSE